MGKTMQKHDGGDSGHAFEKEISAQVVHSTIFIAL